MNARDLQYVHCPFNPEHRMLRRNQQTHILRCMVNYPHFVPCPYNAMHRFETKEIMKLHAKDCTSRTPNTIMENYKVPEKADLSEAQRSNWTDENWDDEYKK